MCPQSFGFLKQYIHLLESILYLREVCPVQVNMSHPCPWQHQFPHFPNIPFLIFDIFFRYSLRELTRHVAYLCKHFPVSLKIVIYWITLAFFFFFLSLVDHKSCPFCNVNYSLYIWWNVKIAHCKFVTSEHSGTYLGLCVRLYTLCSTVKFLLSSRTTLTMTHWKVLEHVRVKIQMAQNYRYHFKVYSSFCV